MCPIQTRDLHPSRPGVSGIVEEGGETKRSISEDMWSQKYPDPPRSSVRKPPSCLRENLSPSHSPRTTPTYTEPLFRLKVDESKDPGVELGDWCVPSPLPESETLVCLVSS